LKIHEYQAKKIFAHYHIPVPAGEVAETPERAAAIARRLGGRVAIKAQVHVGGRGKAGGVRVVGSPEEAAAAAANILGMNIKGLTVKKVLIEEAVDIAAEYYVGLTVDRAVRRNVVMVSAAGGIDIEEVAASTPEKIARLYLDPALGLMDFHARGLVLQAGLSISAMRPVAEILRRLHSAYIDLDASLAEINPLVFTADGQYIATDAKIVIDDNALFRQQDMAHLREEEEEDPIEAEAHRRGLPYVRLDGDIGIIGNGAGLVMTTLDIVKREGGRPANFLDLGGGATAEQVRLALDTVLLDQNVKGVLLNIFGGITRCDEVARGVLEAISTLNVEVPIVIRLTGTREQEGQALLKGSKLIPADTMQEAARMIVTLVKERR